MGLEKAVIEIDPRDRGPNLPPRITVQFNPAEYSMAKAAQIAEIAIPGIDAPILQFVRGQTEKISFELFFDTTEFGMIDSVEDVRTQTGPIYDLLRIHGETHAPRRCRLKWGNAGKLFCFGTNSNPWCLLESVVEEFTLFSPGGVPLRAKLNVTFREAWTVEDQIIEMRRHSTDRTKVRVLRSGQTLSHLAWQEYGDPAQWRPIAEANGVDNPRVVAAGQRLEVPRIVERRR